MLKPQDSGVSSLLESLRDAVIITETTTGRIVYWNPAASDVFGYSRAEVLGMSVEELVPGLLRARQQADLSGYGETGHGRYIESGRVLNLTAIPKGGEEIGVELTLSPIELLRDVEPREQFVLAIVRDVTERKRAEEEVRTLNEDLERQTAEQTAQIENILESITDEFYAFDREWRYIYINERALLRIQTLRGEGLTREDLLGKNVWEVFPEHVGSVFYQKYHEALREQKTIHFEEYSQLTDKYFEVHVYPSEVGLSVYYQDITERKRADEKLREGHALLHSIIEGTAEAIFLKDSQGRYVILNSASVEIVGKSAEQILGKRDADLYPPEVADALVEVDRRIMDNGETITLEETLPVAGAMRTYLSTKTPYRDHRSNIGGVIGVSTDITDRKRTEEKLADQKILLETILNQAADGIVVYDAQGRTTFTNAAASDMALVAPQGTTLEIASEVWGVASYPDGRRIPLEEWPTSRALRGETTVGREMRMVRPDASHYDLLNSAAPLMNREGQIVGSVASFQNITERTWAEEKLREAERRYRTLVETIPAVTYVQRVDDTSTSTYISPQMEDMLGYTPEECTSDPDHWIKILHPADRERVLAEDRRTNETGEPFSMEYRQFAKDGRVVWIKDEATLVRDEEGNPSYWLGVHHDITEHKRAEQALKESELRLRTVITNVPVVLFTLDCAGVFTLAEGKGLGALGLEPGEIVGRSISEVFDDRPRLLEDIDRALAGEEFSSLREVDSGTFEIWYAPLRARTGEATGVIGVAVDVTEGKRAEARYRSLVEEVPAVIYIQEIDHQNAISYISPQIEAIMGYSPREYREDPNLWVKTIYPEDRERVLAEDQRTDETGEPFRMEYRKVRRDGRVIWVRDEAVLVKTPEGTPLYWQGIFADITQRKQVEEAHAVLAELGRQALAETDLQALMDEAVSLVAQTLDVEYSNILELSPEGDELLLRAGVGWEVGLVGRAAEEAGLDSQAGFSLLSGEPIMVEDLREEDRFNASALLQDHGVVSGMSVIILAREQPFGILGAHSKSRRTFTRDDINFLQAVANVLAAAIARAQTGEILREGREAERNRLARDLHDEALQDLTRALVETQLLEQISKYAELSQRLHRVGEALKRTGQGMRDAIYDLRLEGEAREQTFVEMLESLVELSRQSSPDCEVEFSVEDGVSPMLSRTQQVELLRTLREALTNALRHSGADHVRIAVGTSGGKLWTEVEDDGRGFVPTKRDAGMGLKGMRERARALGGDLQIVSKPGEGAKVRFELALEQDREEPEEEVRILLVEDHASVRQAMTSVFEREPGFRVAGEAGSLSEARQMLDGVDVAVVDLGLPDGYGGELIQELRAHTPRAQALVLSAILDRAEIARAVESGAAGVLHKSTGMDEVVEAVRRLRAGETLLPLEEIVELLRFAGSRREEEYEARQAIARLTSREKEILQALAEGLDSREIAERLHISVKTEANHMTSILSKLGLHSRLQALVFAVRHGLVEIH